MIAGTITDYLMVDETFIIAIVKNVTAQSIYVIMGDLHYTQIPIADRSVLKCEDIFIERVGVCTYILQAYETAATFWASEDCKYKMAVRLSKYDLVIHPTTINFVPKHIKLLLLETHISSTYILFLSGSIIMWALRECGLLPELVYAIACLPLECFRRSLYSVADC